VNQVAAAAAELHEFRGEDFIRRGRCSGAGTGPSSKMKSGFRDRSPRSAVLNVCSRRATIGFSFRLICVAQDYQDDHEHGTR
jgi:hypothetical protein